MNQPPFDKAEPAKDIESELDRFRVRDKPTIQRILSDLARHQRQATIYFNAGQEFLLSAVVDYIPAAERLYLDCGTNQQVNQRLLRANKAVAVSTHNQVPIRFSIEHLAIVERQGYPTFLVAQPQTLIRMQRREFFRVATPLAHPLVCRIDTVNGSTFQATVVDISLGGMALLGHPEMPEEMHVVGEQIPRCRIELPGQGSIETAFEVRNLYSSDDRSKRVQIGCEFRHLDSRMTARLQRYINKVQLEQRRVSNNR